MSERTAGPGVRLQKVLARAGVASRRAAEKLIEAGRVRVDGRIARELGVRVDPRDSRVEVDGKRIIAEPLVYIVLNKPRGVVCTLSDPEGRPTVAELLHGAAARVLPVGRLDFNTGGALLCTNDGEFANRVAHPKHHAPKEYLVKVGGVVDERALEAFRESISIDGRATRPADVSMVRVEGDKSWLSVRLQEGRNRQVRRLAEHAGFVVMRLVRTSHAGINVESVRPGHFRSLTVEELTRLRDEYGVPRRIPRQVDAAVGWERPERPERGRTARERPERGRPAGRERPARHERPVRDERPGRGRSAGAERPARDDRRPRDERPAGPGRPGRFDRAARDDRRPRDERPAEPGRPGRFDRAARDERPAGPGRPGRFDRAARDDRRPRDERPAGPGRPGRFDRAARDDRRPRDERPAGPGRPGRFDRAARDDRRPRDERPNRQPRAQQGERRDRNERPQRDARPTRGERPSRDDRPNARGGRGSSGRRGT